MLPQIIFKRGNEGRGEQGKERGRKGGMEKRRREEKRKKMVCGNTGRNKHRIKYL